MATEKPFKSYPTQALFNKPVTINTKQNIIAGPNQGDYWFHSPSLQQPLEREEGPLPIQGNIGALIAHEARGSYSKCNKSDTALLGDSPNCTGSFVPDHYTQQNTCGAECVMKYPESIGDQSFGTKQGAPLTNIHSLHAYENVRAGSPGQNTVGGSYGCYSWIPSNAKQAETCVLAQPGPYQTVGDWSKLPQYQSIVTTGKGHNPTEPAPTSMPSAPTS